jgi:2-methylisocitrate lyase-like PEP mutase family enzyme
VTDPGQAGRAEVLRGLHGAPEILVLVNAWDVASARAVVAAGAKAVATASHSVAAAHGYPDGEQLPRELALAALARVCAAVDVPVTADLESGYGDAGHTARLALEAGAVGCNLEDRRAPLGDAARAVAAVVAAGTAAGVPLVVNARTDAFLLAGPDEPRASLVAEAVQRGRAYAAEGADCVFVPGVTDRETIQALVAGLGGVALSVLGGPGAPPAAELQELGVARVSYGPWVMRVALGAVSAAAEAIFAGGELPAGVPRTP